MDPVRGETLLEIQQAVAECLGRFGTAGKVRIEAGLALLEGHGKTVSADLGDLVDRWPTLPHDARQKRALDLARRLSAQRRAPTPSAAPVVKGAALPEWILPVSVGCLVTAGLVGGLFARRHFTLAEAEQAAASAAAAAKNIDDYEKARGERAERVCDATRARILRGATVGPSDVEGWVVELAFLRDPSKTGLAADPSLADFVRVGAGTAKGHVVWAGVPELAQATGPDTEVTVRNEGVSGASGPEWRGLRLVLGGRYVPPYFDEEGRRAFVRLATAMADRLGAAYGALYAHCAGRDEHHIGSWFYGSYPGAAAAALVYFMGTYADSPHVRGSVLAPKEGAPPDRAYAFSRIATATAPLGKQRLVDLVARESGMVSGQDGATASIMFPYRDSNRASRASRAIARALDIGSD